MTMKRIDYIGPFEIGKPVDIGWGTAILHIDGTVSRRCKGCGVEVRTPYNRHTQKVVQASIQHRDTCVIFRTLRDGDLFWDSHWKLSR